MRTTSSTLTVLIAAAMLLGTATTALAQTPAEDHDAHHPEAAVPGAVPAEGTPQPEAGPGMMGPGRMSPGMMQPHEDERRPMREGMMRMMAPEMMHGMMEGMMRGVAEGLARGLVAGMAEAHGMEPGMMAPEAEEPGMMPRGMMGLRMARGHGVGPGLLYGVPPQETSAERVRAMLEGLLAWHGNPRLELGEVQEEDGTITAEIVTVDGSLVQRLAVDRDTGTFRRID